MAAIDQDLNPWVDELTISNVLRKTVKAYLDKDALMEVLGLKLEKTV